VWRAAITEKEEIEMLIGRIVFASLLSLWFIVACSSVNSGSGPPLAKTQFIQLPSDSRLIVLISDLHMGIGRQEDATWYETEDYRWPRALKGLLDEISRRGNDAVDLFIVGDFLELWQPPKNVTCIGVSEDLSCTVAEMRQITEVIVEAHAPEMADLRAFSKKGDNRLHIIPGNHDAALLLAEVWGVLAEALDAKSGRVNFVESGVWVSPDGRILVEHGHQIGRDVNRYKDWPLVVRWDEASKKYYMIRPWGENFVQKIFNDIEREYPLIDNLSPETAGIRYRMADRSLWETAEDVATFLAFNLFETSLSQKVAVLGPETAETPTWDTAVGRELGYKLFANALEPEDPFRKSLLANDPKSDAVRKTLDEIARDPSRLSDAEVSMYCDLIAIRREELTGAEKAKWETCEDPELGSTIEVFLYSKETVLREHLLNRREKFANLTVFIYGHTHLLEERWSLALEEDDTVSVLNSGAFQRLIDEPGFINRVNADTTIETPAEGFKMMPIEALAPCYTFIMVPYKDGKPVPVTQQWYMPENGQGRIVNPGDEKCE
jgi:UDP-2,3-diacylglucosamine pyrophosphatase LpxH